MATEQIIVSIGAGYVNAGNDTSICIGGTATLFATGGSAGSIYTWNNGTIAQQNNVQPIITTQFIVDLTGGCSASDTVLVTVLPLPIISITASDDTICEGVSTQLNGLGATNYTWTSNPVDASLTGQSNIFNPNLSPIVTTTYTVTGTDNNTCVNTSSITITVNPIPTSAFTINPPAICIGETSTVSYNGTAGTTANYSWNFGGATNLGSGQGPYQVSSNTQGVYQITLTVTENGCISSNSSGDLTVNPIPTAQFTAMNIAGCSPLTAIFLDNSINTAPNSIYTWNFGDGGGAFGQNPTYTYNSPGVYSVSLTVSSSGACSNTQVQNALINVYPQPEGFIYINPRMVSIYEPKVNFYGTTTSPVTAWNWSITDGSVETHQNFEHLFRNTGTFTVMLVVENSYGCVDTIIDYVTVNPDHAFYVPTAFTPNGDGINDVFMASGEGIKEFDMSIFDRWGGLIYWNKDIMKGWNGVINGTKAQIGVYVYKIKYTDSMQQEYTVYGTVDLIR
jgi:gliding motility-associated-like protein